MKKYTAVALIAATVLASFPAFAETVKVLSIEPNVKEGRDFYAAAIEKFEKANPDIKIQFDYLDDTSFKSKLPTLLQSDARPDIFFTWTDARRRASMTDGGSQPEGMTSSSSMPIQSSSSRRTPSGVGSAA